MLRNFILNNLVKQNISDRTMSWIQSCIKFVTELMLDTGSKCLICYKPNPFVVTLLKASVTDLEKFYINFVIKLCGKRWENCYMYMYTRYCI